MCSMSTKKTLSVDLTTQHSVEQYREYLANDAKQKVGNGVALLRCDREDLVSFRHIPNFVPSLDLYFFYPDSVLASSKQIYVYLPSSFAGMNPDIFCTICRKMCALSQTSIVAFRYPLSPEASLSVQINAVTKAYEKLFEQENHLSLNLDERNIVLGGYSSGAYLALHLTKRLLDRKIRFPFRLLLAFPVLDVSGKIAANKKDPIVKKSLIDWLFLQPFLNEPQKIEAFSLLTQDFTNFPPITVITSNNDFLSNHTHCLKELNPKTELCNLGDIGHTDFWYDPKGLVLIKLANILMAYNGQPVSEADVLNR